MTYHMHHLAGCKPQPLASYLKALGVLRLVSQQADPGARGLWKGERFCLVTQLDEQALADFFLRDYAPTPIVAPWNRGSGFYPKYNTSGVDAITQSRAERLRPYRDAIALCREATVGLTDGPSGEEKGRMQRQLRQRASGAFADWMSAVVVFESDGESSYPALLGSGGNDGQFEFTNNFMQRIARLFECALPDAPATDQAAAELRRALWDAGVPGTENATMGQFDPGSVSGANFGNGFQGKSVTNPWDFVLLLEGCVALSAAATRRLAAQGAVQAAAPFAVAPAQGGYASASDAEDTRGEQWFPLWSRPASYIEVQSLFAEGRATLGRDAARGALDLARSIARLGVSRGVDAFERYGYIKRNGQANLATPLGRWRVTPRPHVQLLDEIDSWVQQVRRAAGAKGAPGSFGRHARALQGAMLACCQHGRARDWRRLWFALGSAERQLVRSPKFSAERGLRPLPTLSADWLAAMRSAAPALRLAVSLAYVHDPGHAWGLRRHWLPLRDQPEPRLETTASGLALGPDQVVRVDDAQAALEAVLRRRVQLAQRARGASLGLGHVGPEAGYKAVHAWLSGEIDPLELAAWLPAALALSRREASRARGYFEDEGVPDVRPDATFALLRLAFPHDEARDDRDGEGDGAGERAATQAQGPERAKDARAEAPRLDPALVAALFADQVDRAVAVAARRLRAVGVLPLLTTATAPPDRAARLASALLFPLGTRTLWELRNSVTRASRVEPNTNTPSASTGQEGAP